MDTYLCDEPSRNMYSTLRVQMSMRTPLLYVGFILACVPSLAQSQDQIVIVNEDTVKSAFQGFRDYPQLHLRMSGQMNRGPEVSAFTADIYWQKVVVDGRAIVKVEVLEQAQQPNGSFRVVNRVYGDGVNIFRFDPLSREISAKQYGSISGNQPQKYISNVLDLLNSTPLGHVSFGARMMQDIQGGDAATYSGWLPGNERLSNEYMLSFSLGVPKSRELQFRFNPNTQALIDIRYQETRNLGTIVRGIAWGLTVDNDFVSYVPFRPWPSSTVAGWKTVPWSTVRQVRDGS